MIEILRSGALGGVPHGFLGRRGGVSIGLYAGLNVGLGSSDEHTAIRQNRILAREAVLPGSRLVTVHQVHSPDVVIVADPIPEDDRPSADAMVTREAGLLLGVLTADCVPVLFADPEAGVIGAAHAGWKGALAGVTDNVLTAMEKLGARRDRVGCAVGPCISRASYEVTDDFVANFMRSDPANDRFFTAGRPFHQQFDIEAYVVARLAAAGVGRIEAMGEDTYSQPDRFFSYRRSCHLGEPGYGRQISLIGLAET